MRHGRLITAAIAACATMAIAPAWAAAAPASFVDDSAADFSAGTPRSASRWSRPVRCALTPEQFDGGPGLPTGLSAQPWSGAGTAVVGGGSLTVNNALVTCGPGQRSRPEPRVRSDLLGRTRRARRFRSFARYGTMGDLQHWWRQRRRCVVARRTQPGASAESAAIATLIPRLRSDGGQSVPHRVDPRQSVRYFVNDTPIASHQVPIATLMRVAISDRDADPGKSYRVDSLGQSAGTFQSPVHDAGGADCRLEHALTADVTTAAP